MFFVQVFATNNQDELPLNLPKIHTIAIKVEFSSNLVKKYRACILGKHIVFLHLMFCMKTQQNIF